MPSQEILKIRDGTPLEAEKILTYIKCPRNGSVCYFYSKLDVSSNVVQKKILALILFFKIRPSQEILKIRDVAWILFFKIRPSQESLKIRDGTPLEAEEIYIRSPQNGWACYFSSKLDVSSNVVHKKRVARILFFKIRPSQKILKIRDATPLGAEEIFTYIKSPRNGSVCYFSSKLDVPSNVVQKKILAWILFFKIRPPQEILKIRDGTPLEAEEILTYIKSPRNGSICYFSSKLDIPSNVVQKKRVERILFFKIRSSQGILKIRDGTPMEAEEILTYIKAPEMDRPSQEILKIRDGTPLEAENILTYIKRPRNGSVCYFSSKLDVSSNVVQKKRVARILFFQNRPSQKILKIRDATPLGAEEIFTYIKSPRNGSVRYFYSKLYVPSNVVQKKILARILFFKIRQSQEILKIRDGTPLEAEEILTYIKSTRNGSVCYFSSKLDVPSNVVQKKRVAWILFFKIRPSQEILKIRDGTPLEMSPQEILKIRDGTPLEAEEILTCIKSPRNGSKILARILFFKIRPSQEILKIRDGTPLEAEEILTYIKSPRNGSVCYFSSKLDVPSNVVQKKRVAWILFFKIRPSQEILKIRDGTPLEMPSQESLKIRDGTPLEAEEIYIRSPQNGSACYFSSKLDVSSNVVQKKRVARILFFKIRPSQKILKIRDATPLGAEEIFTYIKSPRNGSVCYFSSKLDVPSNVVQKKILAWILFFKIRPPQEILKIRDGTPLEAEEILTYIKSPRNGSICYFSSKLDIPSNVVQKKRVAISRNFKNS
ncbi:hypothetical protein OROMI_024965 [Orobanche minor]